MQPKILITGASGTIGTHLCNRLVAEEADFTAMVRNPLKAKALNDKGIKTTGGDLSDRNSLFEAMQGMDKLFLLSSTSPDLPGLQGKAVKAAVESGIRHIVKISVRGADINGGFNIARYHGEAEQIVRESGIPFTFLRPHSFMQNLFFDSKTIHEKDAVYSSLGTGKIPMIDARDIADVAFTTLTQDGHEGESWYLTGPEAISYEDIAGELSKGLGRKISVVNLSLEEEYNQAVKAGMPLWLAGDIKIVNRDYCQGRETKVSPDVEKIIGRKATSIDVFIKDHIDRFR
jgi:uncharacterized protein YbjT (DUF2867 family)